MRGDFKWGKSTSDRIGKGVSLYLAWRKCKKFPFFKTDNPKALFSTNFDIDKREHALWYATSFILK